MTRACICGSDLWPYRSMDRTEAGQSMRNEAIGVVEAVGRAVGKVKVGDLVIMPFAYSDGRCDFCHEGQKIRAAVGARSDPDFMIIARCDALTIAGMDEVVQRGEVQRSWPKSSARVLWPEFWIVAPAFRSSPR